MSSIISFFVDIAKTPAFLVAFIALLGLILQKKSAANVTKGTIKTFVGFLVLSAGAGVIVSSLEPFGGMFEHAFNVKGVVPNNEAIVAVALQKYGTYTALIMLFGMLVNILIAKFTNLKYIFLTGHHTLYMACMIAVIMQVAGFDGFMLILTGSLALGMIMSFSPYMLKNYMKSITGNDAVGLGHFSGLGYYLSGLTGKLVRGKKEKVVSTEDIKFPKGLSFLRDSTVSISITMMIVYVIVAFFAGSDYMHETYPDGGNFVLFSITKGGEFAAGVYVILSGVRMILAEIVPAFKGISEKLVKNSKPALDCPIVYTYAPNAVLIGFFSSFLGGIFSLVLMSLLKTVIIIPGVVPHFFCGSTAGVFGNAKGGLKGCILGAFLQGVLISFLPIFLMPVMGDMGFAGSTFSDADFGWVGILYGSLGNKAGVTGVYIGLLAMALLIGFLSFKEKKAINNEITK